MKKSIAKFAFAAALVTGAAIVTAAPASAQSFGLSFGGPGYSFSYNSGYPYYGYYGRPYYYPAYPYYYGPRYYYSTPRYYGRPYYRDDRRYRRR